MKQCRRYCMVCLVECAADLCDWCTANLRRGRAEYDGLEARRKAEAERVAARKRIATA